ncbi:hypothetical protein ACFL52_04145 [Candidatus Margulisiibacteriota bacterium]
MKRIVWLLVLIGLLMVSVSYAEYLSSADCMPAGKVALSLAYAGDQYNEDYVSSSFALTGSNDIGVRAAALVAAYGLTNKIEVGLGYGTGGAMGPGLDITAGGKINLTMTNIVASVKLGIKQEAQGDPFSTALGIIAKSGTVKTTMPGALDSEKSVSSYTVGLLASKMAIPFVPYVGIGYEINSCNTVDTVYGSFDNALGLVVGTALFVREDIATFWEISSRRFQPELSGPYTILEYACRVAWAIN